MKLYNSFSVWVFVITVSWFLNLVHFSPLGLLVTNFGIATYFIAREYDISLNLLALAMILIHAKPLYLLRHSPFALKETLAVFLAYNAFLAIQGTTLIKEYKKTYTEPPKNIVEFIKQG